MKSPRRARTTARTLEPVERTFLRRLGQELRLDRDATQRILAVMLIKNGA
jgi:hypothetical protein